MEFDIFEYVADGLALDPNNFWSYDIETDYDHKTKKGGDNVILMSVSDGTTTVLARAEQVPALVRFCLYNNPDRMVGHNSWKFDDPRTGISSAYDTLVMSYMLDENQPLNLGELCLTHLNGIEEWKHSKTAAHDSAEFEEYCATDTLRTHQLFHALLPQVTEKQKFLMREVLHPVVHAFDSITKRGIAVNIKMLDEMFIKFGMEAADAYGTILELTGNENFNPASNKQVGEYLSIKSVCKVALKYESKHQEFALAVLKHRHASKMVSTYMKPYIAVVHEGDGRVHATYSAYKSAGFAGGTVVGRSSCSKPNVQNIPRELAGIVGAGPGKVHVSADYNALHIRLAAFVANSKVLKSEYSKNPLWDPHRDFAARLYGKAPSDITDNERQIAKSANFALLYEGTDWTLMNYLEMMKCPQSSDDCKRIHRAWHKWLPEFKPWYEEVKNNAYRDGYVETIYGRRRHFPDIKKLRGSERGAAYREAINFMVLGLEPEITFSGLIACYKADLPLVRFVHDSNEFEFPTMYDFEIRKGIIDYCMTEASIFRLRPVGPRFDVSLRIEFKVNGVKYA